MNKNKLQALRDLLKKDKEKSSVKKRSGDKYPFWEIPLDQRAVIRFLPDGNKENIIFYVEKLEHILEIKENGEVKKERIPCLQMYGEKCPICKLSQDFYKAGDKESGKYYYRVKYAMARALIVEDPLPPDEETGKNYKGKVCTLQLSYQLHQKIKEQLLELLTEDEDTDVTDFKNGYDFIIKKVKQGEYENYTIGSGFARKPRALTEEELQTIELVDLTSLLPENPGVAYVKKMLDKHISGSDDEEDSDEMDDEEKDLINAIRASSKKKSDTKSTSKVVNSEDDEDDDEPPFEVKTKTNKKVVIEEDDEDDEDEDDEEYLPKSKKPAKLQVKDDDDDDDDDEDILALIKRNKKS